jgi:hypothetical protein
MGSEVGSSYGGSKPSRPRDRADVSIDLKGIKRSKRMLPEVSSRDLEGIGGREVCRVVRMLTAMVGLIDLKDLSNVLKKGWVNLSLRKPLIKDDPGHLLFSPQI